MAGFLATLPAGSSVERSWRIALAAMLAARHLERPVDLARVLEMALAEALPGSAERVRDTLDPDNGLHLFALLLERRTEGTSEARLVQALGDLLDGRNTGNGDRFLADLSDALHRGDGASG